MYVVWNWVETVVQFHISTVFSRSLRDRSRRRAAGISLQCEQLRTLGSVQGSVCEQRHIAANDVKSGHSVKPPSRFHSSLPGRSVNASSYRLGHGCILPDRSQQECRKKRSWASAKDVHRPFSGFLSGSIMANNSSRNQITLSPG